jgi:hypothetical protein
LPPFQDQQYDLGSHNAVAAESAADEPTSLGSVAAAYRAKRAAADSHAAPAVTDTATEAVSTVAPNASLAAAPAPPAVAASVVPAKSSQAVSASIAAPRHVAVAPAHNAPVAAPAPSHQASLAVTAEAKPAIVATRVSVSPPAAPAVSGGPAVASVASPGAMDPPIPAPRDIPAVAAPADASLREVAAKPIATVPESDEYPDTQPEDASADPQCRVYFSAYGLGAEQYKWLSDTRQKQFSGICPAPNVSSVDFVILFTHDSDSYITAMPTPVHADGNGFSDFDPMTTVDTALMSPTEADKTRYELAWVFRVKRGGFDPAGFSPRRRPQYTATSKGSHASTKAVEDAFNFIAQQAPTH